MTHEIDRKMMVDKELLELLICPETQAPLHEADENLLARLNGRIQAGRLANRSGRCLEEPLTGGLVAEGGRWLYPVIQGIPVLLVDEAIQVDNITEASDAERGSDPP